MFESPVFADNWPSHARRTQREKANYVASELARLDRAGQPLLLTVLQQQDLDLQQVALDVLRSNGVGYGVDDPTGFGEAPLRPRNAWRLRLVADERPPTTDPQGRPLPDDLRGRVLVAKVGNLGGERTGQQNVEVAGEHSSTARTNRVFTGRSIYRLKQVRREAQDYTFDDAVAILRQWGVGVAQKRYRRASDWYPGMPGESRGQCQWLVEEVPLPAVPGYEIDDDGFGGKRSEYAGAGASAAAEDFGSRDDVEPPKSRGKQRAPSASASASTTPAPSES